MQSGPRSATGRRSRKLRNLWQCRRRNKLSPVETGLAPSPAAKSRGQIKTRQAASLREIRINHGSSCQGRSRQTRRAHGSGQGHPGDRQRAQKDSLRDGERKCFARAGWPSFGRAGRRVLGPELQHTVRYATARARPRVSVRRCPGFCGPEVLHLSTRDDSRLPRNPDTAGIRVRESELDQVLRLRKFFLVAKLVGGRGGAPTE